MNNVLPRVVRMHLKYDLKGSTYKRRASKKEREKAKPTFKDLDFMQDLQDGLILDQDTYNAMVKTLQRDCLVRLSVCVRKDVQEREQRAESASLEGHGPAGVVILNNTQIRSLLRPGSEG